MSRLLIVRVVSELVARMHVLYNPLYQRMHVLRRTDQLVTRSLGELRMRIGGGGGG